jgi:hypothetical protein
LGIAVPPSPTPALPLGGVLPTGDISPIRVEVFQILNPRFGTDDPEIPLVADKETRIRVYVRLADTITSRPVKVQVEAIRGGLGGQVLEPCFLFFTEVERTIAPTPGETADIIMEARDDLSRTFNFRVPKYCPAVDAGDTLFRVTVSGPECPTCALNNVMLKNARFHTVRAIKIKPYVVRYVDPASTHDGKAPAKDIAANFSRLFDIYPISNLAIQTWGEWDTPDDIDLDWPDTDEGKASFAENWAALHDYFIATYGLDDVDSNMAIVHKDIVSCRGRSIGVHSIQGGACGTYSHELGHTIGLPHSSDFHGECDGGSCQPEWPYGHGSFVGQGYDRLRPNQLITPEGAVADGNVISFWHSHDFMSYGDCEEYAPAYGSDTGPYCKTWISPLHYAKLAQRIQCGDIARFPDAQCLVENEPWNALYANRTPAEWAATPLEEWRLFEQVGDPYESRYQVRAASLGQTPNYLHVNARIWPDGRTELRPLFTRALPPAPSRDRVGRGSHQIELLDAAGAVLFSRGVDPSPILGDHGDPASGWYLNETLPWDARTSRVVIRRGGQVLAERTVTGSAPTVRLLSPNGGERLDGAGRFTITWDASDPDGDPLSFLIDYSPDGGRTWEALVRNVRGTSHSAALSELRGTTNGLIRVHASDGVNTSADVSDAAFIVPRRAPMAEIETPAAGATLRIGQPLELRGAALDAEDGLLPDAALQWSSSLTGRIGAGSELIGVQLGAGEHVVTLTATDSDGQTATASVRVIVGGSGPSPAPMRIRTWSGPIPY